MKNHKAHTIIAYMITSIISLYVPSSFGAGAGSGIGRDFFHVYQLFQVKTNHGSEPLNSTCLSKLRSMMEGDWSVKQDLLHTINLTACQQQNPDTSAPDKNNVLSYYFPYPRLVNPNRYRTFRYGYVGMTDNHIAIFALEEWGGGTGTFDRIILTYPQQRSYYDYDSDKRKLIPRTTQTLTYLGEIIGGDRNCGSIDNIKINHNTINIIRMNPDNYPVAPSLPNIKESYDLSSLTQAINGQ